MTTTLTAGLGLKPQHFDQALRCDAPGIWYEVHPENYLVAGGPRLAWLEAVRARHPLSLHGVSLSLAAAQGPDPQRLRALAELVRRVQPALVSEHLAWSTWRGRYYPDLLPVPRTRATLDCIAANIGRLQDALGRRIAIENPSHYVSLPHTWGETDFLAELARRSGCGLLVDINNAHVSAHNLGDDAGAWLDALPAGAIMEVHLAGHRPDAGGQLLVDSHDSAVAPAVWALFRRLCDRIGPVPTLIERDGDIPPFAELLREREQAHAILLSDGKGIRALRPRAIPPGADRVLRETA
ncbi:MNIO family bufferin maturase [Duganella callida]|uniref:DUF692 domain-containing protein n=1 Tax=Duganella callida TaxID=2561932 RepID=A0A4Y9S7E9_9BURK|nr:DUF692 domain-containing protein [Duganella callida]TFW17441.1 DUF692 domain-containing protein [Duganella callida]